MATQLASDRQIEPELHSDIVATEKPARSGLERFLDSFFQPANIKWMLIIGSALVLGSSLMLVTNNWSAWSGAVKYLAMLGYTAAIYIFAEIADRRLGLKSTGNVLRALCILLMPVLMFGLSWVATLPSTTGLPIPVEVAVLFMPATAMLFLAGRRILNHFLRGHQVTFWVCYSLLALAGGIPPIASPILSFVSVAAFWAVMTIGVVKVNRHVFWLAEEHRMPRIFGFFPILLLGSQFILLSATKALAGLPIAGLPIEWLGLAIVMLAGTVLATTRTIASVFRARTGDLVRPLPWSIALPLFVGVLLTFVGVIASFYGFQFIGVTTKAVVPTAMVATALMFVVAYDTRHWAFTALALILLTVVYQCAPTLFSGLVPLLKASAEFAVNEKKLPFAFYGITYLPLLGLLTGVCYWLTKKHRFDMSTPIQMFITGVSAFLWCSSLFNIKATFIVAAINLVTYLVYAVAFRDRRYAIGSLVAAVVCAASWSPFANAMFDSGFTVDWIAISLIGLGGLLYASKAVDSLLALIPLPETGAALLLVDNQNKPIAFTNNLGLAMLASLASLRLIWLAATPADFANPVSACIDAMLFVALAWITYRKQHYVAAFATTLLPLFCGVSYANYVNMSWMAIADIVVMVAVGFSIVGLVIVRRGRWHSETISQLRQSFGMDLAQVRIVESETRPSNSLHRLWRWVLCHTIATSDLGTCIAVALGLVLYAPNALLVTCLWGSGEPLHFASAFVIVWLFANVILLRSQWAAGALSVVGPVYASSVFVSLWPAMLMPEWAPVIWVSTASLICSVFHFQDKSHFGIACLICRIWLSVISIVGFVYLSIPIRIAVAIAMTTLLTVRGNVRIPGERMFVAILCNVHALLFVATLAGAEGWILQPYSVADVLAISAALLPAITFSILVSDVVLRKINVRGAEWWGMNLRLMAAIDFVIVIVCGTASASAQGLVLLGIAIAIGCELLAAIRQRSELRAWSTIGTVCLLAVLGWNQGWFSVSTGWSRIALVVISAVCLWLTKVVSGQETLCCFTRPLKAIGLIAPGIAVILAIGFEIGAGALSGTVVSRSINTMAILGAGGLYFFHGLSNGQRRFTVLAAAIFNVGLALLWFTNGFTDLQFYCVPFGLSILGIVELLKKELPKRSQDPLRYVGALVILVSPVFGMLDSGWLHLFSLMVLCVLVVLLAIGLRIRVLMYTGTAFLFADLAGILIQSSIDNRVMLWVGGVGLGGAVIALAALCENHRENVLAKIRLLSAELASWN
jgi:hypothetical protein